MKNDIKKFAKSLNIDCCGVAPLDVPPYKNAVVCLFPYYNGEHEGNISKYARGEDYHIAVRRYLRKIADFIYQTYGNYKFEINVDSNAMPERYLADLAGLGLIGENSMLINEKYGSYVFIGTIMTDLNLEFDKPNNKSCKGCGECRKECPGEAIVKKGKIEKEYCLSNILQKKELTESQEKLLKKSKYLWGCDICQDVCPHNKHTSKTPFKEFSENLIYNLPATYILSDDEFKEKFSDRAFAWRGKKIMQRNIEYTL